MLRLSRSIRTLSHPFYHRMVTSTIVTGYRQYSDDVDLLQLLQNQSDKKDANKDQQEESTVNLSDLLTSMKIDRTSASYNITPEVAAQNAAVIDIVKDADIPIEKSDEQTFQAQADQSIQVQADQSIQKSEAKQEKTQEQPKPLISRRDQILEKFKDVMNSTPNYNNEIQDVSQYHDLIRYVTICSCWMITVCITS